MFASHTTLPHAGRDALALCGIALMLGACVPYPHSVTRNPAIEGRVLSAETGQAVAGAKIELDIGSDESWRYETISDTEGRFAFDEHNDYRLFTLLADAPRCGTTLSISAPGYHARQCSWISMHWCSSTPIKLPPLTLQPKHIATSQGDAAEDLWRCIESAKEQAH
jgi:hypothetical protein